MTSDIHHVQLRANLTGHICAQYSYFDYLVTNIIWHALKADKSTGMIITGNLDIRPKIEMALSLLENFNIFEDISDLLQKYKNNASNDNGFISKRNLIIHGIYSSREGDPKVMVELHRKKTKRNRQEMSIKFIQQCLAEITLANNELTAALELNGINVN